MNNKIIFLLMFLITVSLAQANINVNDVTISTGETTILNVNFINNNLTENITFSLDEFTNGNEILNDNFSTQTIELVSEEEINFTIEIQSGNAGNYTGTFNANNESKNITLIITEPAITTPNKINFSGKKNSVKATAFNITNTGSEVLENLTISTTLSNYTISPTTFNLNPGDSQTITLEVALIKKNLGIITVSNNKVNKNIDIEAKLETGIEIKSLDIDVDGRTDRDVTDGQTISKDANPGDEINFDFELKNVLPIDITNALVEITLENVDEGDDKIIDKTDIDIDSGDDENVELSYILPNQLDDDKYTLTIHIEGEDDDGKIHEIDWEIYLKIDKERHEIVVEDTYLSPNSISCSQTSTLRVELANSGKNEETAKVIVTNNKLNLNSEKTISLDKRGKDAKRTLEVLLRTDKVGTYEINVDVYMEDKLIKTQVLPLTVKSCNELVNKEKKNKNEIEIIKEKIDNEVVKKQTLRDSKSYLLILGSIVVILFIFVLMLLLI